MSASLRKCAILLRSLASSCLMGSPRFSSDRPVRHSGCRSRLDSVCPARHEAELDDLQKRGRDERRLARLGIRTPAIAGPRGWFGHAFAEWSRISYRNAPRPFDAAHGGRIAMAAARQNNTRGAMPPAVQTLT